MFAPKLVPLAHSVEQIHSSLKLNATAHIEVEHMLIVAQDFGPTTQG